MWLALPVVSYYVGFINVVLYNYDRFMLPVCLVLSLFGGFALDRWLSRDRRASGRGVASVWPRCLRTRLLYAATVDVAMLRDSRYTVEQWLASHVAGADAVGFVFPLQYYPRLDRFNRIEIMSVEEI